MLSKKKINSSTINYSLIILFLPKVFLQWKRSNNKQKLTFLAAIKNPFQKKIEIWESNFGGKKVSALILPAFSYWNVSWKSDRVTFPGLGKVKTEILKLWLLRNQDRCFEAWLCPNYGRNYPFSSGPKNLEVLKESESALFLSLLSLYSAALWLSWYER